jgi:GNAT superfamily N-acetyltransferase
VTTDGLRYREGTTSDLKTTFGLSERAIYDSAAQQGIVPPGPGPAEQDIRRRWIRYRPLVEFIESLPGGAYWICENDEGAVGYARVVRLGQMEELTELMVRPDLQGAGIGRALLERCWPVDPTPDLGRVVIAAGAPRDLSLYSRFGVMPIAGHWHMRHRAEAYLERRSQEIDATEPAVHVLKADRAVAEWKRLEPSAIAHERAPLHEFFAGDRNCLAQLDSTTGEARGLCWVSGEGEIGPAVAASTEELVPVVLAALDRVAKTQEPDHLSVYTTTISWWLLRRLRGLGFHVFWPSWVMCSVPLPGLDRYLPTRPPHLL